MQRFKSFITEQADPAAAFEKAKAISIYLTGARKDKFLDALDMMIKGSNDKQIYNAPFTEAYSYGLVRGVEAAWEKCRDLDWNTIRPTLKDGDQWDLYSFSGLNGLKKFEKAWTPHKNDYPKQWAFVEAIRDLPDAVKVLKTYVVKGKPPKEPAPGTFVKPMATVDANKMAVEFLNDAVASFKLEYYNSVRDSAHAAYEEIKKAKTVDDLKALKPDAKAIAPRLGAMKAGVFVLFPTADEILKKLIDNTVNDVIEGFVGKNTSKLALILHKKGGVASHKILSTRIRNSILENSMRFDFADGSGFTIESQVVYKFTQTGKPFLQFPTRFTNVTMADGTKMKMPSEEKMIKEF